MTDLMVGGLYSVVREGFFQVVKILALDDFIVHLRMYRNRFSQRPTDIDLATLIWDIDMNDMTSLGIGHFPLAKDGFWEDEPVFIKQVPVSEEELEGYRIWLAGE